MRCAWSSTTRASTTSVLCEFRARLLAAGQEALLFDLLLARCREAGLVRAAIRTLNRLESVGEALRHALHALAAAVPDWLRGQCPPEWADRYGQRLDEYRLPQDPAARRALALQIGADGARLLQAAWSPAAPAWLRDIPAVETLRRIWVQHDHAPDDAGAPRWRADGELPPCAVRITSPHDPEARCATKRETSWLGYKVHLTEACDADAPHLITAVQTTAATAADSSTIAAIHTDLAGVQLLPGEHLVDAGYLDADHLVASRQDHGVDLVGPPLGDTHWQARTAGAFDIGCFAIDWGARRVTCPQGHTSGKWSETTDPLGNAVITMRFAPADCLACPCRAQCTRSAEGARRLTLRPQAQHLALRAARARQATPTFAAQYAARAGIEGTISQGVNTFDLREARYIGLAKTHLQQLLTGAAMNVVRLGAWFAERPRAATRPNKLALLLAPPLTSGALA